MRPEKFAQHESTRVSRIRVRSIVSALANLPGNLRGNGHMTAAAVWRREHLTSSATEAH